MPEPNHRISVNIHVTESWCKETQGRWDSLYELQNWPNHQNGPKLLKTFSLIPLFPWHNNAQHTDRSKTWKGLQNFFLGSCANGDFLQSKLRNSSGETHPLSAVLCCGFQRFWWYMEKQLNFPVTHVGSFPLQIDYSWWVTFCKNQCTGVDSGLGPALISGPHVYSACVSNTAYSFHRTVLCQSGENVGCLILVS